MDPLINPNAPAGPRFMPEYEDPLSEEAAELSKEASHAFDLGVEYRKTGEHYVRVTVILAAVLFLIAIGQRFKIRGVRYAVNVVAGVLLVYALYPLRHLPAHLGRRLIAPRRRLQRSAAYAPRRGSRGSRRRRARVRGRRPCRR